MRTGIIYCATSPSNKKYIGQTINGLKKRKNAHKTNALNKKYPQYFYRAIRKYGFDNFKWQILEEYKKEDRLNLLNILNERELYWIKSENTCDNKIGYNEKIGGNNGFQTDKTKMKIKNSLLGKKHTEERRLRISEAHKGKDFSKNFGPVKKGNNNPNFKIILDADQKRIIDLHINYGWGSRKLEKEFNNRYSFIKILKFLRGSNIYKPQKKMIET